MHRDVKPQNVIVRDELAAGRRAKLMDFGIARVADAATLTATGEVVGTLAYMSPEQAEGELAGPESDVYSLGLTAYECWAGVNPIAARTPAETARRIGAGVPPLRVHRPDLPEGLADTIDACLETEPELRPSPIELRECLEAEMDELDAAVPLGSEPWMRRDEATEACAAAPRSSSSSLPLGLALVALAGPLGVPGLALVLAALSVPSLLVGATAGSLAPLAAAPLGAIGLGGAGAALGAAGPTPVGRAVLGLGAWCWLAAGSVALGIGPDLGLGAQAPDGWTGERRHRGRVGARAAGRPRFAARRGGLRPGRARARLGDLRPPCLAGAPGRDALVSRHRGRARRGRRRGPGRRPTGRRRGRRGGGWDRIRPPGPRGLTRLTVARIAAARARRPQVSRSSPRRADRPR